MMLTPKIFRTAIYCFLSLVITIETSVGKFTNDNGRTTTKFQTESLLDGGNPKNIDISRMYYILHNLTLREIIKDINARDKLTITNNNAAKNISVESITRKRKADEQCDFYINTFKKNVWLMPLALFQPRPTSVNCQARGNPLIIGGKAAQPGEFPHMAAIGWQSQDSIIYLCSGSIISNYWVITAAHCTHSYLGRPKFVKLGVHNLKVAAKESLYKIHIIKRHPSYKPPLMYADVALLKLSKEVIFNERIKPACLYTTYHLTPPRLWATGWGITELGGDSSDFLQKTRLDVINNVQCALVYNHTITLPYGVVPSMLCAGDLKGNWKTDTCQGDSGGPLQVQHPSNCLYSIVGITSFGKMCSLSNFPGVYTRISHYIDWIEKIAWPDN